MVLTPNICNDWSGLSRLVDASAVRIIKYFENQPKYTDNHICLEYSATFSQMESNLFLMAIHCNMGPPDILTILTDVGSAEVRELLKSIYCSMNLVEGIYHLRLCPFQVSDRAADFALLSLGKILY